MKLPEPVAWRVKDDEASDHYGKSVHAYYDSADIRLDHPNAEKLTALLESLFTESQLREALAQQAEELEQLQEQNTYLDKVASELQDTCDRQAIKLGHHEAVMRQALDALIERDEYRKGEVQYAAIKALEGALK